MRIEQVAMDLAGLERLLADLRDVRTDHQGVEAKRAGQSLPKTTHETLSAFANAQGGLLLLGVDEATGTFDVTGVADPKQIQSDLQATCALMQPPIRARMDLITHPDGVVLAAAIPPAPRNQRPCHRAGVPAESSSYIRIGDGDQLLTAAEVAHLLANSTGHDYSAAPAPAGSGLDPAQVTDLLTRLRSQGERYANAPDAQLLRQCGATTEDGHPTYAGVLALGNIPQLHSAAASVTYRRLPRRTDPPGTRYSGKHLEGTVGALLEDTLAAITADLTVVQVVREGAVLDELDVPREALREVLSNALIHRSLSDGQRDAPVLVEVSDEAVVVTSPGSLHYSVETATLGLTTLSGVRNLCLVRLCEQLRTPGGARIVEHQNSGIAAADQATHNAGSMPVLFVDHPDTFQAILLRGTLDNGAPAALRSRVDVRPTAVRGRLLAVLARLGHIREEVAVTGLGSVCFDAHLVARALAPCTVEDAAAELRALEDAGILRRTLTRRDPGWVLQPPASVAAPAKDEPTTTVVKPENGRDNATTRTPAAQVPAPPRPGRRRPDRVPELLTAIAAAPEGVLSAKGIGQALALTSPSSRNRWIRRAADADLIVSTVVNQFDPTGGYRLTPQGQQVLKAEHRKSQRAAAAQAR